jgi:serine/threonine protein phosphatase PrpC
MSELFPRGTLAVSFGEVCDRGKVREENQDSVRNASIPLGELFIVADGIGGYQGGATASRMVVDGFSSQLAARPADYPPDKALIEACTYANLSIHTAAMSGDPSLQRMGSTVVLALIQTSGSSGPEALIGHVGDSRAYLIRGGQMMKLTNDHSAVQALLNRNLITEEEARNHPDASVLTRSLGHRPEVEIEIDRVPLQPGDALLLCSDGLWGYVADADIAAVATDANLSVQTIADTLLHQALAAGGQDNIGIEFIRIESNSASTLAAAPLAGQAAFRSTAQIPAQDAGDGPGLSTTGSRHTLQILAIGLLLLGGCGYLGVAAHSRLWPFNHVSPRGSSDQKNETTGGTQTDGGSQRDSSGANKKPGEVQQGGKGTQVKQPEPASPGKPGRQKKVAVVGEVRAGRFVPPTQGEIEWRYASIQRDNKPACARLAKETAVVYANKSEFKGPEVIGAIVKQYPDLRGKVGESGVEPQKMTPAVRAACGEEYDVVVIMPDKKPASVSSAPTDAPAIPRSTDSQDHSPPVVQQHPKLQQ